MFVGVDVGTGSARAGVFDADGTLLASHKHDIRMWRAAGGIAEQSSDDIWAAVCTCVREAVAAAGIAPEAVRGIGFDAACSMAVLDRDMRPLCISASGDPARNVIVWMDHRATDQAARINAGGHRVLDYVGGRISPEMQTPKLLWLREQMPETFAAAGQFFDLPDFLTWSTTGSLTRSACTVTCKWTYLAHEACWDDSYFQAIGLGALAEEGYARIGQDIVPPGTPLAQGLTPEAAAQMGLVAGLPVGAALIDAHAGGVATVGAEPQKVMAYVFGTSACTMASATAPQKVPGVWGPYFSAMVPGLWLSEGGQSAAGAAIDHVLAAHPASHGATEAAKAEGLTLHAYLLRELNRRSADPSDAAHLAGARIIVPDFLGNRAPFADPAATGIMSGLSLGKDLEDLLACYVAAILGVGYGLRQIMDAKAALDIRPTSIVISGGAGESEMIRQLIADAVGLTVTGPQSPEPVLLGAAMLGATASGAFPSLTGAMAAMSGIAHSYAPAARYEALHGARYQAYKDLQKADFALRERLSDLALPNAE